MAVVRQWKISENKPDAVLLLQIVERLGKFTAWWALKIAELFECNRRILRSERMDDFAGPSAVIVCDSQSWVRSFFGAVKPGAASNREQRHDDNDEERQGSFHETGRKI